MKKQRGFTLFELLFLVFVLSGAALLLFVGGHFVVKHW